MLELGGAGEAGQGLTCGAVGWWETQEERRETQVGVEARGEGVGWAINVEEGGVGEGDMHGIRSSLRGERRQRKRWGGIW